jgi:hypothetical protein
MRDLLFPCSGGSAGDGASRKCDDEEAAALLFKTRKG